MRKLRIIFKNALYHIISRGNNKKHIFHDSEDRLKYMELLKKAKFDFNFKFYAYVLMDNHTHLLIETPDANISDGMKMLNLSYCKYFNSKYKKVGHLFESRYKAKLVQRDRYFLAIDRYIHRNPVKANICRSLELYPWSGHNEYVKEKTGIINRGEVLDMFGKNLSRAIKEYVKFCKMPISDEEWKVLDKQKDGVIGDLTFINKMEMVPGTKGA